MTILIITLTALIIGIIIVIIDTFIKTDEEEAKEIENLLPGLNCGCCGYGTCKGMSKALTEDKENYKKCRPLRGEKLENFLNEIDKHLKKNC